MNDRQIGSPPCFVILRAKFRRGRNVFRSKLIVLGDDRTNVREAQDEIKHQQHDDQSQGDHGLPVGIGDRVNQLRPPLLGGFAGAILCLE